MFFVTPTIRLSRKDKQKMKEIDRRREREQIKRAIDDLLKEEGIVISHAKTMEEVCASVSFNGSIDFISKKE